MVNPKWRLKFNGGNPVWLDENDTIVRFATTEEIYERSPLMHRKYMYGNMTEEQRRKIDDLFGNPTSQSVS